MDDKIRTWLYDVYHAVEEIESFFDGAPSDFTRYQQDVKTKRAVERNIGIIGEAVNRILKEDPSIEIDNARNIIGTRNRIIHSYDSIADEIIWSILVHSLPNLKSEIEKLLKIGKS